jgi:hypothetical protein
LSRSAVIPGKGDALGHALVDDVVADLRQPIDVGFPGPEIAALDRVVEQPPDAVAVVGVVLGGVDATLGGDAVGAPRAVLDAEGFYVVAQFGQGGRGRATGQAGADDDDVEFSFIGRIDQFEFKTVAIPFFGIGPPGIFASSAMVFPFWTGWGWATPLCL